MARSTVAVRFTGDTADLKRSLGQIESSASKTGSKFAAFAKRATVGLAAVGVGAALVGKSMIDAGWLEETRSLLDRYDELSPTAAEATGYHELIAHLRGEIALDDAIEQIKIATRQLARRQMKWFRRFQSVRWMLGTTPPEEKLQVALSPHAGG